MTAFASPPLMAVDDRFERQDPLAQAEQRPMGGPAGRHPSDGVDPRCRAQVAPEARRRGHGSPDRCASWAMPVVAATAVSRRVVPLGSEDVGE